ncbi:MAG: hypothetical protein M0C28_28755 [Candidatus Moduliflexus flocculans]|nr:hypothetical protein [Candidatus Moduliflexus flocculans]
MKGLEAKLNSDEKYASIAKNWEGDLFFLIEPEGNLEGDAHVLPGPVAWHLPKG